VIPLDGRRIAILGGAGFIGHHLALELAQLGAEVSVIDSLQVNNLLAIAAGHDHAGNRDLYSGILTERLDLLRGAGVHLTIQDIRDYHAVSRILEDFAPQAILHAAAVAHAGQSNKDPHTTFDHSLRTLENALDYARGDGRVEQFVFLSSSMVYGNFLTPAVDEEHPLDSIGIYGALKVAGEKIVIGYNQVFDLPYTIVRPSALYGPRCISRRVSQLFIEDALAGQNLRIEGDGSERLDFTYIDDLVQGLVLVLRHPAARGETFNMTYGQSRSIAELAEFVQRHFPGTEIERVERDRLMPVRGTLSVEKARRLLGYAPAHPLELGIEKYAAWYRDRVPSPAIS
jgi:nucleoside-diphosphate-sugar epimerase